jgi:hypothetical protein
MTTKIIPTDSSLKSSNIESSFSQSKQQQQQLQNTVRF